MCKNSSAPSINAALWHYLGTYNLDFRCENNSTPGVLIEEIRYESCYILLRVCNDVHHMNTIAKHKHLNFMPLYSSVLVINILILVINRCTFLE